MSTRTEIISGAEEWPADILPNSTRSQLRASRLSDSHGYSNLGKISRMELKVLFSEDPAFVVVSG